MKFMVDTGVCIYVIRQRPAELLRRFRRRSVGEIGLSSITLGELAHGAEKSQDPARNRSALEEFLAPLEVAPFDQEAAKCYGNLRAEMERKGAPIGPFDTLIAAHAVSLGVTLVTHNTREFSRAPGLRLADWTRP